MVPRFILLSSLLLISATLVIPSSLVETAFARGHEDHQSQPTNLVASRSREALDRRTALDWAGASVAVNNDGHHRVFQALSGNLTVANYSASDQPLFIFIAFDLTTREGALSRSSLQAGIKLDSINGKISAYYYWRPGNLTYLEVPLVIGDELMFSIQMKPSRRNYPAGTSAQLTIKKDGNTLMSRGITGEFLERQLATWAVALRISNPVALIQAWPQFPSVVITGAQAVDPSKQKYDPDVLTDLQPAGENKPVITVSNSGGQVNFALRRETLENVHDLAGVSVEVDATEVFNSITGAITVPDCVGSGSSIWIGFDPTARGNEDPYLLFGIEFRNIGGTAHPFGFYYWHDNGYSLVDGFPIESGDTVRFSIQMTGGPGCAHLTLANIRTRQNMEAHVSGRPLKLRSAMWGISIAGDNQEEFKRAWEGFRSVNITGAVAKDSSGEVYDPESSKKFTNLQPNGQSKPVIIATVMREQVTFVRQY